MVVCALVNIVKHLRRALTFWYGQVTWEETAEMHGYPYVSPDTIVETF